MEFVILNVWISGYEISQSSDLWLKITFKKTGMPTGCCIVNLPNNHVDHINK